MKRLTKFALKHIAGKTPSTGSPLIVRGSSKRNKYHAVVVTCSKGGVGKSTVAIAIALNMAEKQRIGLLDADIESANEPTILNLPKDRVVDIKEDGTIIPLKVTDNLELVSIANISDRDKATSIPESGQDLFIRDASEMVEWSTSKLIIDLPGGTNMFNLVSKHFTLKGAIIVTMPNQREDTLRIIDLCLHTRIPILGLCENFSSAVWDDGETIMRGNELFAPFGYDTMHGVCDEFGIEHFGNIPLLQNFSMSKVRSCKTVKLLTAKVQRVL